MRNGWVRWRVSRRSVLLAVAFSCAADVASQVAPSAQPTSGPAWQTIATARQRIAQVKSKARSDADRALLVALDFLAAVGTGDGHRAGLLLDAVGYQALPLTGELPERPDRPLTPAALEKSLAALPRADWAALPTGCVEHQTRAALAATFSAVATWMLPQDQAVVFHPWERAGPSWIRQDACLVIRIRGERATIIGGNLLEALTAAAEKAAPAAEDK
jgi:hypothetical protein